MGATANARRPMDPIPLFPHTWFDANAFESTDFAEIDEYLTRTPRTFHRPLPFERLRLDHGKHTLDRGWDRLQRGRRARARPGDQLGCQSRRERGVRACL